MKPHSSVVAGSTKSMVRVTPAVMPSLRRCGDHECPAGTCDHGDRFLQRSATGPAGRFAPPIVHRTLGTPGQALETRTRASMERHFGHDFSRVRIHGDATARESARAVNAMAFTVGQHIVLGERAPSPTTPAGTRMLAHELTHVVQQ